MSGLKPCPFCGGIAELCDWNGGGVSWVRCSICGADIEAKPNPRLAVKAWNTRAERTCKMEYVPEYSYDEFYPTMAFECSECEHMVIDGTPKYCPNCGAKVVE